MGGEITILHNYPEILYVLAKNRNHIRIVTNGQWFRIFTIRKNFIKTINSLTEICKEVDVAISTDKWHKHTWPKAFEIMQNNCPKVTLVDPGNLPVSEIVPVGRAWDNNIVPDPQKWARCNTMGNMFISEDGMVCKCPFGYFPWKHFTETSWYEAKEYVLNWRSEQLTRGMTCCSCMEHDQSIRLSREKIHAKV
jgi:hypothetical protein